MGYYILVNESGLIKQNYPPSNFSIEDLQDLVGGYIEVISRRFSNQSITVVCNEEGRIYELPFSKYGLPTDEWIAGTYLILKEVEGEDGMEFTGLTEKEVEEVTNELLPLYL